ncbi:MAG: histidinol dehydrogenase, partial [Nitrospirota bacterium]
MMIIETKKQLDTFLKKLKSRASGEDGSALEDTRKILLDVKKRGDKAVLSYSRRFDRIKGANLRISKKEISEYARKADQKVFKALKASASRIRKFHVKQKESSGSISYDGARLGQMIR